MFVIYIKETSEKCSFLKKYFKTIDIETINNGYIFTILFHMKNNEDEISIFNKMFYNLVIKKIKKFIIENSIEGIVISKELINNKYFIQHLKSKKKDINKFIEKLKRKGMVNIDFDKIKFIDGSILFKNMAYDIVKYVINIQNKKCSLEDIYILINNFSNDDIMESILFLISKFRNVNIITENVEKFKIIEENIYRKTGIYVTVSNNKRKSLKRARYIINIDFGEEINSFNLYRKAVIIDFNKYNIKNFEGIKITSFDIDTCEEIKEYFRKYNLLNSTSLAILYESTINKKDNFLNIRKKIENSEVMVTKLYGNNGVINENEYKQINLTDYDSKKYY